MTKREKNRLDKATVSEVLDPLVGTPHTLIAGTTGSGKSILLNDTIMYLLHRPSVFTMFDLKRVELKRYDGVSGVWGMITEPEDVLMNLDVEIELMERRFQRMAGTKSTEVDHYLVIDELADMVTIPGVLERLTKIGRLGRAANIHLLCATQDPSRRTLSAQLMQNFTCTVALRCRSAIESRQIIGVPGAEELPKYGYGIRWDADGIEKFRVPFPDQDAIIKSLELLKG